ncbi:hypothetical protein ACFLZV_00560 [Candidatus Margulisiibacteriota bacterium]
MTEFLFCGQNLNEIRNEKYYPATIRVNKTLPNQQTIYIGLKIDQETNLILDCKWKYNGNQEEKNILSIYSEILVGKKYSEPLIINQKIISSYLNNISEAGLLFIKDCLEKLYSH